MVIQHYRLKYRRYDPLNKLIESDRVMTIGEMHGMNDNRD